MVEEGSKKAEFFQKDGTDKYEFRETVTTLIEHAQLQSRKKNSCTENGMWTRIPTHKQ